MAYRACQLRAVLQRRMVGQAVSQFSRGSAGVLTGSTTPTRSPLPLRRRCLLSLISTSWSSPRTLKQILRDIPFSLYKLGAGVSVSLMWASDLFHVFHLTPSVETEAGNVPFYHPLSSGECSGVSFISVTTSLITKPTGWGS